MNIFNIDTVFRGAAREWAERSMRSAVNLIRDVYLTGRALRRRTGTAARSVTAEELPSGDGFRIGTTLGYLIAWERGIRAHTVRAKNAQALRFTVGGVQLFRKSVRKPAQAARPSFEPALNDLEPQFQRSATELMRGAIEQAVPGRTIEIRG